MRLKFSKNIIFILGVCFVFCKANAQSSLVYKEGKVVCPKEHNKHSIKVYVGNLTISGISENQPSILGEIKGSTFTPLIPFGLGQTYTAVCGNDMTAFTIPLPDDYQMPHVIEIYPTDSVLPANLLKFYVRFNKPMATQAYKYVFLLDKAGKPIKRGVLKEIPELWNEDRTELCVWLEPGRIKQGLGPNEKLGPVMEASNGYTISISQDLRDAEGIKMPKNFTKDFKTSERDTIRPDYNKWQVIPPKADSFQPLTINFNEVMDHGSTLSLLSIQNANGEAIPGDWQEGKTAHSVIYRPAKPWEKGRHKIVVSSRVEDRAGNNLNRLFDQNLKTKKIVTEKENYFISFFID